MDCLVHGVTKSWTRLKRLSSISIFCVSTAKYYAISKKKQLLNVKQHTHTSKNNMLSQISQHESTCTTISFRWSEKQVELIYEDRNQIIGTFGGMEYWLERSWTNFWECPWYEQIWVMITSSLCLYTGFPHSSVGKESTCNPEDPGSIPGSGRPSGEGIGYPLQYFWASLVAQLVKNPPAMWETWVLSLAWEGCLEKGKATHSSILAWRIPWTV